MEEFNIGEFLKYYLSQFAIVVFFIVFGALGCWYYTNNMQVAMYKSQTSVVLRSSESYITPTDVSLNKNLVSTYREIIKSRRILSRVIENLGLDVTEKELSELVSVSSTNDTELIYISVVNEDNKLACNIANEIAEVFMEEVPTIYNIENVALLDDAEKAEEPYNVNVLKQYIIGIGAGVLLGSLLVVVLFYFDDSIKSPEEIEEKVGLSVLSTVPKYKNKKKKGGK